MVWFFGFGFEFEGCRCGGWCGLVRVEEGCEVVDMKFAAAGKAPLPRLFGKGGFCLPSVVLGKRLGFLNL